MGAYDGKTAVVTGGSNGMGRGIAEHLVNGGARVLVTGRTAASLDETRSLLGVRGSVVNSDAGSMADIEALAEQVKAMFGSLDVLVLNAGVSWPIPFLQTSETAYDEIFRINAKGPYFTAQKLVPLMAPGSAIVLTTSVANVQGSPMFGAYAASKAALRSLTRNLAAELLPVGIRVNAVSPGPIRTSIIERADLPAEMKLQAEQQMIDTNPMKRIGGVEEIASAVAFLAFDATFTTGAELPVDGGLSQL